MADEGKAAVGVPASEPSYLDSPEKRRRRTQSSRPRISHQAKSRLPALQARPAGPRGDHTLTDRRPFTFRLPVLDLAQTPSRHPTTTSKVVPRILNALLLMQGSPEQPHPESEQERGERLYADLLATESEAH